MHDVKWMMPLAVDEKSFDSCCKPQARARDPSRSVGNFEFRQLGFGRLQFALGLQQLQFKRVDALAAVAELGALLSNLRERLNQKAVGCKK